MKTNVLTITSAFLRSNKYTLLIFFITLFRPQIMNALRHTVLPAQEKAAHQTMPKKQTFQYDHAIKIHKAGFLLSGNDGCSDDDDDGCDSEEDSEYYDNTSSSDGCSDEDDGCETSSSSDDNYYGDDGNDDGCYCGGETVISDGSGGYGGTPDNYFNPNLRIQFTLSHVSNIHLTIKDVSLNCTIAMIVNSTTLPANFHSYLWDGEYNYNSFITNQKYIPPGNYTAVLRLTRNNYEFNVSRGFTYSDYHGFQVDNTSGYVIDFGTLN
jgi:hypothetical protein